MRLSILLLLALNGCASVSMGTVTRTEVYGQQTVCWEPSRQMNGFVQFIANHLGSVMAEPPENPIPLIAKRGAQK